MNISIAPFNCIGSGCFLSWAGAVARRALPGETERRDGVLKPINGDDLRGSLEKETRRSAAGAG
ncbi:MAG: hypothetical protein GY950_17735 [bacterium]|nr:hypothetical protein [bacterium]